MKHCVFFSLLLAASLTSCAKHDEVSFRGTVVNIEYCASQDIQSNAGFYTALEVPEATGATFTIGNDTFQNVVILYEPGTRIKNGDRISGSFYIDNDYSRYDFTLFSEEEKRKYRDEHFHIDLQNAYELGKRLALRALEEGAK